ncbi:hypothetical protein HZB08_01320 [Candidatus Saganbacteria bacterium]|uniref:Histidine kinase N-terminal 7TM region domain-containing protein n=1 Tax=Candidatus Saganbacteria bacterium TaxID=2575572 RepID=A0A9D6YVV0_UNCSA|nr:hypothetical protein [Candidatus Saganbacteria bacterium]
MSEWLYYFNALGLVISLAVIAGLAVYVYSQNRFALINRVFSSLLFLVFLAGLFEFLVCVSWWREGALFFYRLQYLPGLTSLAAALYFLLIFPEGRDLPPVAKIAIFSPVIILGIVGATTGLLVKDFKFVDPKYLYLGQPVFGSLYPLLFINDLVFHGACAACLIYKWARATGRDKTKISFVMAAFLLGLLASFFFIVVLPALGVHYLSFFGKVAIALGVVIICYDITRYGLFQITPHVAADEILASLGETVMVCDPAGNVLYQRKGKETRLPEKEIMNIVNRTVSEGHVEGYRVTAGKKPLSVSTGFFKKGGGVVMVFHDLTDVEGGAEKEKEIQRKLKSEFERAQRMREVLTLLVSAFRSPEVERFTASAKALALEEPEDLNVFEKMAEMARERVNLLAEVRADKVMLEKRIAELEKISRESLQKELKIIGVGEKVRKLKKARKL